MKVDEILTSYGTDYRDMTYRLLGYAELEKHLRAALRSVILCSSPGDSSLFDSDTIDGRLTGGLKKMLRIGIKPNLVTCSPAQYGATTHPEVVEGIIMYLFDKGYSNVTIYEGSWAGDDTGEAFEYCGYRELSQRYGVKLEDTKKLKAICADACGMQLNICSCIPDIDFLINVPVLKGHCQTRITCALKNMKGLIPDSEKRRFHKLGLHKPIAHLNTCIHQDFIVVDHICGDPSFEEGGNPETHNCVMAAADPVLTDIYGCSLLGIDYRDIGYIKTSLELGTGPGAAALLRNSCRTDSTASAEKHASDVKPCDLAACNPAAGNTSTGNTSTGNTSTSNTSTNNPAANNPIVWDSVVKICEGTPDEYISDTLNMIQVNQAIDDIDSCSTCHAAAAAALKRLIKEGKIHPGQLQICVGQGFRGRKGLIGAGDCTSEFSFTAAGCPPEEDDIYRMLDDYIREENASPAETTDTGKD